MKQQRPGTARAVVDGLKLHRHAVRLNGAAHTVITLRPGAEARFSTNRFHETWHVLSDPHGAALLARLLWGLAYQARPGTVVLIDRPFLTPTPFDADPAERILLVPGWCTSFDNRSNRLLKKALPLRHSTGTVRWRTHGLDQALAARDSSIRPYYVPEEGTVRGGSGTVVLTPASPLEARDWAVQVARLNTANDFGSDYVYLGPWRGRQDGEVQVFRRFRPMVGVAGRARARVLARPDVPAGPGDLRAEVWREAAIVGDVGLPRSTGG
ncbi:hypothetical protein [Nocardia asteroides]|uniref:hypothetical protein n=1 Tax=Nocardia asteroides TaxID=1824 RepID=UPI001E475AEA|nr:hypothetical protein [Nocardia asteroides]UGT59029.1 hypothetical protein LTT61_17155 [Nocardia asteroides]